MADQFISLREAARRLGVSTTRFGKVAASGAIRRIEYPGVSPRYSAADVAAVASSAIKAGPRAKAESRS